MTSDLFREFRTFVTEDFDSADADRALVAADFFLEQNEVKLAASAYDKAWALKPEDDTIRRLRGDLLNELAIEEHGIHFRYVL